MAVKFTKQGRGIWDHIDSDESRQPILFQHQIKSLRRRVWGFTWLTLAALIKYCLIGGGVWLVVILLNNSSNYGI